MPRIRCLVCGISSTATVFRFPSHTSTRERWMGLVRAQHVTPTSGVCVNHFKNDDISFNKKKAWVSPGPVPSLSKLWVMALHHVFNEHVKRNGTNMCHHDALDEDEHELEWLTKGSDAHKALQDVVLSPRTLGLSRHVASFRLGQCFSRGR